MAASGQIGRSLLDDHELDRTGAGDLRKAEGDVRVRGEAGRDEAVGGMTEQERRILELIGEGLTNRQIGERMFLAEKTVKNYVSSLFATLGMERRTQAAAYAARVFDEDEDSERGRPG